MVNKKLKGFSEMFVIVRTYSAGVHCGEMINHQGREVLLANARRIWRWRGANSLHELSKRGCDFEYSRISEPVAEIRLMEAIEIITCEDAARENLSQSRWGN
jgi:hypothetical protein